MKQAIFASVKKKFFFFSVWASVNHARILFWNWPGLSMKVKFLAQGNTGSLWWGLNSQLTGIHRLQVRRAIHCATPPPMNGLILISQALHRNKTVNKYCWITMKSRVLLAAVVHRTHHCHRYSTAGCSRTLSVTESAQAVLQHWDCRALCGNPGLKYTNTCTVNGRYTGLLPLCTN